MSIYDNTSSHPVVLHFTSEDRSSGTNSNFTSTPFSMGVHDYDSVCLTQASIPRSFYNCPSGFNTFNIIQNGITSIITLTVGSYNKYNLRTELQQKLNASADVGRTYTVTYPTGTQVDTFKYTFSFTGGTGNVSFVFGTNMFKQMGFNRNSTNAFSGGVLVSTNCINLSYFNKCFIKSNICLDANDDTLEEILNYGSTPMLSLCYFQQQMLDANTKVLNVNTLNSWQFSLVDEFNNLIDLNGIPWGFSLVFFKRNDTHQIHRNELIMQNEERLFNIQQKQMELKNKILNDIEKKEPDKEVKEEIKELKEIEPSTDTNKIEPITLPPPPSTQLGPPARFPVLPYFSSSIVPSFL